MLKNERGFTLVEVLMAVTIFAIGFLAMAKMQMTALQGNSSARGTTEASSLLQAKIGELRMIPYGVPALDDWSGVQGDNLLGEPTVLTLDTVPPAGAGNADPATSIYGNTYRAFWTVDERQTAVAGRTTKLVRVVVVWNDRGVPRRIFTDFIRNQQY